MRSLLPRTAITPRAASNSIPIVKSKMTVVKNER